MKNDTLALIMIFGCISMVAAGIFFEINPFNSTTEYTKLKVVCKGYSPGGDFNSRDVTALFDSNGTAYLFYGTENLTPIQLYDVVKEGQEICIEATADHRINDIVCMCKCEEAKGGN